MLLPDFIPHSSFLCQGAPLLRDNALNLEEGNYDVSVDGPATPGGLKISIRGGDNSLSGIYIVCLLPSIPNAMSSPSSAVFLLNSKHISLIGSSLPVFGSIFWSHP